MKQVDEMERRKKNRRIALIIFLISLPLSICLCACAILGLPFGLMDFPCFVTVEDGYLMDVDHDFYEVDQNDDSMVFVTTTAAHMGGAGCLAASLNDGEDVTTPRGYTIRTDGDLVIINQDIRLAVGDSENLESTRFGLNPFWYYIDYLNLTNEGTVQGEIDRDGQRIEYDEEVLVAIGSSGDRALPNPVTAGVLLLSLCAALVTGSYLAISLIVQLIRRIPTKGDEQPS